MTMISYIIAELSTAGRILCDFGPFFALSPTLTTQKIKILLKLKKTAGDMNLHKCTINDNRIMYGSGDMEHGRDNFL